MAEISIKSGKVKTLQANVTISGAVAATGLIKLTTSAVNALETGDIVQISGVTGTTEANGQFVITVVDTTHFSLNNSVFLNAYVSGGTGVHIGYATAATLVDNTVFASVPDYTLQARIESLSSGSNARIGFFDAVDLAFVTEQPLKVFQVAGPVASNLSADVMFTAKRYDTPDTRMGASGDNLRVKIYISGGPGSVAQFSAWLFY